MSFDCLATLMTPFIDSHCHLTDPAFAQDLDAVISRMKNASMTAAVTIGCEDRDIEPLRALLDRFPGFLFGAWAVHPEYPDAREADADEIAERASEPGMVAVGETGLDFYWCKEPLDWQRDRFRRHIEAAGEVGFVMHCFCGTLETARGVVNAGGHVSFTGNLTFKKNAQLRAIAAALPLEKLMIETDAPYMAPVPYRGKRCEPWHSMEVARATALAKNLDFDEVLAQTCRNTVQFFGLVN